MELLQFIEEQGVRMQTRFQGYGRREVRTLADFLSALQNTLLTNVKFLYVKDADEYRTVGINTGHVGTSDYNLTEADREFVVARGYNAISAFMKYYVAKNRNTVQKHCDVGTKFGGNASKQDDRLKKDSLTSITENHTEEDDELFERSPGEKKDN